MKRTVFTICLALFATILYMSFSTNDEAMNNPLQDDKDALIEKKIDSLLAKMTLEEKIGQMALLTSGWDVTGPTINENYMEFVKKGTVGNIFNAHTSKYNRDLQKVAVEETRLGIPLLFGYDVIHGYKTIFPIPLGEAASWDLEAIEKSARVAAEESAAAGLHWTFAPMVDIARDPRWGRVAEGAGEDTYLGVEIAKARVKGFQGDDLGATNTILACAKHFAAYGAAQAGRDYHTVDISERVLRETYLPPFKAAVDAGVATFMTSFNELDGVPASGNKHLLTEILRDEWGFDGFVVTDYTSINEMIPHGVVANEKEAGALALKAGVDMDMQGSVFQEELPGLVKEGKIKESEIDQAVRRILRMKYKLGLFDDPYRYSDEAREKETIMKPEYLEASRDVAKRSIVLLKNENNVLPINDNVATIAVIGPLADNQKDVIGNWHGAGDFNDAVSLLTGIKERAGDSIEILYAKGSGIDDDSTQGFTEAVETANKADLVILAIGEAETMSGEAASRSSIDLPGVQLELAKEIHKTGKPVAVVLMNGRPLAINWLDENVPAILETWFLGTQAGNAIADVLFGDYNPSGKLPMTFPRSVGQVPIYYNMKNTGRPISDNKYTSKYLDIPNTPLYPFGYGLSYTTFEYSDIEMDKNSMGDDDKITASITVKNIGKYAGEEVVQLYIRDLVGSVTRPVKELKGFQKINLGPGESKKVDFEITPEKLAFYRRDMTFGVEPGEFKVFIGTNSVDVKEAEFEFNGATSRAE